MSSLYWRPPGPYGSSALQTTKKGAIYFSGSTRDFQEWKFRTEALYESTDATRRHELASTVLEGLSDNAYLIARDLGIASLTTADGVPTLIKAVEDSLFPITGVEAKELYDQGHRPYGPLSRQKGESLHSFISRRKRWWSILSSLDGETSISEPIRADLLLDMANLSEQQKLLIKTTVNNRREFDEIATQMMKMFPKVHLGERSGKGGSSSSGRPRKGGGKGKRKGKGKGKPFRKGKGKSKAKHAYNFYSQCYDTHCADDEEWDDFVSFINFTDAWGYDVDEEAWNPTPASYYLDDSWTNPDYEEYEESTVYAATADEYDDDHADDSSWYGSEYDHSAYNASYVGTSPEDSEFENKEQVEIEVLTAFIAAGTTGDTEDEVSVIADAAQTEVAAFFTRGKARSKGVRVSKGKGKTFRGRSGLSLEDRKKKLREIKAKSHCKKCGKKGHWAGDPECAQRTAHFCAAYSNPTFEIIDDEEEEESEPEYEEIQLKSFTAVKLTSSSSDTPLNPNCQPTGYMVFRHPTDAANVPVPEDLSSSGVSSDWTMAEEEGELRRKIVRQLATEGIDHSSDNFETELASRMAAQYPDVLGDRVPEGSNTVFRVWPEAKGETYLSFLRKCSEHRVRSLFEFPLDGPSTEGLNSCETVKFIKWLRSNMTIQDGRQGRIIIKIRDTPLQLEATGGYKSRYVGSSARKTVPAANPDGPCPQGCRKDNCSLKGSNGGGKNYTCFDCGHSWFEKFEDAQQAPAYSPERCPHLLTDNRGSCKKFHRVYCKQCCTYLSVVTQAEHKSQQAKLKSLETRSQAIVSLSSRLKDSQIPAATAIRAMELALKMLNSAIRRFSEMVPPRQDISEIEISAILQDALDIVQQSDARRSLAAVVLSSETPPGAATSSDAPVRTAYALHLPCCQKRKVKNDEDVVITTTQQQKIEMQYSEYCQMKCRLHNNPHLHVPRRYVNGVESYFDGKIPDDEIVLVANMAFRRIPQSQRKEQAKALASSRSRSAGPSSKANSTSASSTQPGNRWADLFEDDNPGPAGDEKVLMTPLPLDVIIEPIVNIFEDPGIWVLLDDGCNYTSCSLAYAVNYRGKLRSRGFDCIKTNSAIFSIQGASGGVNTTGDYTMPIGIIAMYSGMIIPGSLRHSVMDGPAVTDSSATPMLLSCSDQGTLGLIKDKRTNAVLLRDYPGERIRTARTHNSNLQVICISDLLDKPEWDTNMHAAWADYYWADYPKREFAPKIAENTRTNSAKIPNNVAG